MSKSKKKVNQITFRLPNELLKALDEDAKRRGISRNAYILQILNSKYLTKEK